MIAASYIMWDDQVCQWDPIQVFLGEQPTHMDCLLGYSLVQALLLLISWVVLGLTPLFNNPFLDLHKTQAKL